MGQLLVGQEILRTELLSIVKSRSTTQDEKSKLFVLAELKALWFVWLRASLIGFDDVLGSRKSLTESVKSCKK